MSEQSILESYYAQADGSSLSSQKEELLTEIKALQAKIAAGDLSSWGIIQIMLDKLTGMSNTLTNGLGKAQQGFEKVQNDMQKVEQYIKKYEADRATDKTKSYPGDARALAISIHNLNADQATLKKLIIDGDPTANPPIKPYHGDNDSALNMYYELFGKDGDPSQGGCIPGIYNYADSGESPIGPLCDQVAANPSAAIPPQLQSDFDKWADDFNNHATDPTTYPDAGPFDKFENGYTDSAGNQHLGLTTVTSDLSSTLTDENNLLNQDSQIINSVNSICQSSVKNTTDMYSYFAQHQVTN